jgi:uncharacterized membrane protein
MGGGAGGGVIVFALSGAFAMPGRPLAFLQAGPREQHSPDDEAVSKAFEIAGERRFGHDPRFSLVIRSEIAGRALSPAVTIRAQRSTLWEPWTVIMERHHQ